MDERKREAAAAADNGSSRFMSNRKCEYFPCHKTDDEDGFNCLFCYCPLYALGDRCGGRFRYTEDGIKDCSDCLIPHGRNAYDHMMERMCEVTEMVRKK